MARFVLLETINLQISETFGEWSSTIKAVPLTQAVPEDGTLCKVSGWGYTSEVCQTELLNGYSPISPKAEFCINLRD